MKKLYRSVRAGCCSWIVMGTIVVMLPGCGAGHLRVPSDFQPPKELAHLRPLPAKVYPIPNNQLSGYTAMCRGPDNKIYVGGARYLDYGHWFQFDPRTKKFKVVVDTAKLFGESRFDINTNSKTHSKLAVGPDGKIWGSTKQGHEIFDTRPEIGEESNGYPGGHLISYDPANNVALNHGVLKPADGAMNGLIDGQRRRIYFRTEPRMHFLIYDIDTGQIRDKGRLNNRSRYIDQDPKGNVWITEFDGIAKYDVERDELFNYEVVVEGPGSPYHKPYPTTLNAEGTRLYGADYEMIQEFDLTRAKDGIIPMRYVCKTVPEPFIESRGLQVMFRDPRGRIYWSCVLLYEPGDKPSYMVLMRYDPRSEKSECLGYIMDIDRPNVIQDSCIQGFAQMPDGTVYLKGICPYRLFELPGLMNQ